MRKLVSLNLIRVAWDREVSSKRLGTVDASSLSLIERVFCAHLDEPLFRQCDMVGCPFINPSSVHQGLQNHEVQL